jgi:prephenate dehydrogenase
MKIAIVGLDLVGTSLALALKSAESEISITGHDPVAEHIKRAKDLKAIDKSHWNLITSCEDAEVVILDLPLSEVEKTLEALAKYMKPGTLILDTAPVKRPVMALAARLLPTTVQFIGGHLVSPELMASTSEPAADLTKGATFFLVTPENVSAETINMATTLAEAVGATPRFIDAEEHDGLMAATCGLPLVGAIATFGAIAEPAGWQERCKSVGAELFSLGALLGATPDATAELALANADYLVPWIDAYTERLGELRQALADNNREAVDKITAQVHETLLQCLRRGEEPKGPSIEDPGMGLRTMFLGGLGRKKPTENPPHDSR